MQLRLWIQPFEDLAASFDGYAHFLGIVTLVLFWHFIEGKFEIKDDLIGVLSVLVLDVEVSSIAILKFCKDKRLYIFVYRFWSQVLLALDELNHAFLVDFAG